MAKRKSVSAKGEPATVTAEGSRPSKKRQSPAPVDEKSIKIESGSEEATVARFLGEPVPLEEARNRWPLQYWKTPEKEIVQAKHHFLQAEVDDQIYNLEDDARVKAEDGKENYICKIVEFFQAVDGTHYFTAQWYYRAQDTVIGTCSYLIENKQVFFSEVKDDNLLDCLVKKLRIQLLPSQVENPEKETLTSACDNYYDKMYLLPYTSFVTTQSEATSNSSESGSTISSERDASGVEQGFPEVDAVGVGGERTLLDLYSGCGAMSTGLCLGANSFGVKLVTKWAVDLNKYGCESLKLNHPESQVSNEKAEEEQKYR